jgi:hypothetical protein
MRRFLMSVFLVGCASPVRPEVQLGGVPEPLVALGTNAPQPLRRLTRSQYGATVKAALGSVTLSFSPQNRLPLDEKVGPFATNGQQLISAGEVDVAFSLAEAIAREAAAQATALAPCNAGLEGGESGCAVKRLLLVAERAYRRPLAPEEHASLSQLVSRHGPQRGLTLGLTTVLASPSFLYLPESGITQDGRVALDGPSLATRLSFFVIGQPPDAQLMEAAAAGALGTPQGIASQTWRLLADDRAEAQLGHFHAEWLDVERVLGAEKDMRRYPFFTPEVRQELLAEYSRFADTVIRRSDGRLSTLLSAPFSIAGSVSRRIYGLETDSPEGSIIGLPPNERGGLLTLPAFLAAHANAKTSSPVHRGLVVLTNLLCVPLGSPPPSVDLTPIGVDATGATTRRALVEQHSNDPACAGCHKMMDPIGLAFERYDAVGAWRTIDLDGQRPIDARVDISTGTDIDGVSDGPLPLITKLAESAQVRRCATTQWYRFALGRTETEADRAELEALTARFEASRGNIPDLIVAITTSDAFRTRAP